MAGWNAGDLMHVPSLIEKKRDGGELTDAEIEQLIGGFTTGEIPDYQMSALAMAIFFRGMNPVETAHLTRSMMQSGRILSYPPDSPPKVDKHSTGGVGDKVSLVLAPLLACDEVWVPMISGRGLGTTGGTLDKLESIPGFNVSLSEKDAMRQLARIGVFITGQTADICPADKKLYALRDVTATVPSQPLIIASIMSKKLAENLDRLVLDVKFGSGAFMKTHQQAHQLADGLSDIGRQMNVEVSYLISPMDEPLGRSVGNALEVAEAVAALRGDGNEELVKLVLDLCERVASASREQLQKCLNDGSAWRKFVALVEAQGGDAGALEKLTEIHRAPVVHELKAERAGSVSSVEAAAIAHACLLLGAGRQKAGDAIDFAVGCSDLVKNGMRVEAGDLLMRIHARDESSLDETLPIFKNAFEILD